MKSEKFSFFRKVAVWVPRDLDMCWSKETAAYIIIPLSYWAPLPDNGLLERVRYCDLLFMRPRFDVTKILAGDTTCFHQHVQNSEMINSNGSRWEQTTVVLVRLGCIACTETRDTQGAPFQPWQVATKTLYALRDCLVFVGTCIWVCSQFCSVR